MHISVSVVIIRGTASCELVHFFLFDIYLDRTLSIIN